MSQHIQLVLAQSDQPNADPDPVSLQTQHVEGPLFFLGIGLLIASFVFVTEALRK